MSARLVPAEAAFYTVVRGEAVVEYGEAALGDPVSVPLECAVFWYDTRELLERNPGVGALRRASAVRRELGGMSALRSSQAYGAKEGEARAWLDAHPEDDGAVPGPGYLTDDIELADEIEGRVLTAHAAATDIVARAEGVRVAERARRRRKMHARQIETPPPEPSP